MPLPGFPTSIPPGDHWDFLLDYVVDDMGTGSEARVTMRATTGYGGMYWGIFCNRILIAIVNLPEGLTRRFTTFFPSVLSEPVISAAPLGDWEAIPPGVDAAIQQEYFVTDKAKSYQYDFDAVISQRAYGTGASQLSNWALTGLRRYQTGRPVENEPTQIRIDIVLTKVGSTITVQLYNDGLLLAEGSRTGNGTVELTERNGSGLAGNVDVAHSANIAFGAAYFLARWPRAYKIYLDGALYRTMADPGLANKLSLQLGPLSVGPHELQVLAISDTAKDGSLSAADSFTVPGRPEAPGVIALQTSAGDWTNTKIQFPVSATPGVTYRYYDSDLDGPTNLGTPVSPAAESELAGIHYATLPTLPAAAAGKRRIIVMAVNSGVEDGAMRRIVVEYDAAGAIVLPRPNVPGFGIKSVTNGKTFNVEYNYDTLEEKGVATHVQLFLVADGSAVNWSSPDVEQALGAADGRGFKRGLLSAATAGNGLYRYAVRARTSTGVQSPVPDLAGPRWSDDAVLSAPANRAVTPVG